MYNGTFCSLHGLYIKCARIMYWNSEIRYKISQRNWFFQEKYHCLLVPYFYLSRNKRKRIIIHCRIHMYLISVWIFFGKICFNFFQIFFVVGYRDWFMNTSWCSTFICGMNIAPQMRPKPIVIERFIADSALHIFDAFLVFFFVNLQRMFFCCNIAANWAFINALRVRIRIAIGMRRKIIINFKIFIVH